MSDLDNLNEQPQQPEEKKKTSLAEAMRLKLEAQKQHQGRGSNSRGSQGGKKMQSQHTKKSTMHRRTGGQ